VNMKSDSNSTGLMGLKGVLEVVNQFDKFMF
jgi:hypothetical protein